MFAKRVDVNIMCSKCQVAITGGAREMTHDVANNEWLYTVRHHGSIDSGKHLRAPANETSHNVTLWAFRPI